MDKYELIYKYITDSLTQEEQTELTAWCDQQPTRWQLLHHLQDPYYVFNQTHHFDHYSITEAKQALYRHQQRARRRNLFKRVGYVAVSLLFIGSGIWLARILTFHNETVDMDRNTVTLSLSSGNKYALTTAIHIDNNEIVARKEEDTLRLEPPSTNPLNEKFVASICTIKVPIGKQFMINLDDGTRVFLNANSELQFPNSFVGQTERVVSLKGEAYFEVQSDSLLPFKVVVNNGYTKVLGTEFLIKSYEAKRTVEVTLFQGSVEVHYQGKEKKMNPGEQLYYGDSTMYSYPVDLSRIATWRKGRFTFRETSMEEIMNTLSQWYGFNYFFESQYIRDISFTGTFEMSLSLGEILNQFTLTEDIVFKFHNNVVVVESSRKY